MRLCFILQIKKEYTKLIEDSGEKVQISDDCYNLVDRYLRKLDLELHKFKVWRDRKLLRVTNKVNFDQRS